VATDREPVNFRVSKITHNWLEEISRKLDLSRNIIAKQMILLAKHDLDTRYYPFVFSMLVAKNQNETKWVKPKSNKPSNNKIKSRSLKSADDFEGCCRHITDTLTQFKDVGFQPDENQRCGAIIKIVRSFCTGQDNNFKDFNFTQFGKDATRDRLLEIAWQNEPRMQQ
jgi:hypothetical protein